MSWQCDECDQAHFGPVEGCSQPGWIDIERYVVKRIPGETTWWQILGDMATHQWIEAELLSFEAPSKPLRSDGPPEL